VTDEELSIFAGSGAVASSNPGSNLRLSTGICRVRDIMDAGGRIAFGTDGISFSDRDDFFAELRLACYLQRLPRDFGAGRLDSEQVLRAAAANGAQALGMAGTLGSLEPGKYADLLIVAKDRIFFPPGRYAASRSSTWYSTAPESSDIDTVMVGGRVLMEHGRVTVVNEALVRDRFAEAVAERVYRPSAEVRRWAELGHPGRALPARVLPALVRDPDRAGLRLQRQAPAQDPGRSMITEHSRPPVTRMFRDHGNGPPVPHQERPRLLIALVLADAFGERVPEHEFIGPAPCEHDAGRSRAACRPDPGCAARPRWPAVRPPGPGSRRSRRTRPRHRRGR